MSQLLKTCISFTGDVDTVAAIALATGAHSEEIEQDLPTQLYEGLERTQFGYDYIMKLDKKLIGLC